MDPATTSHSTITPSNPPPQCQHSRQNQPQTRTKDPQQQPAQPQPQSPDYITPTLISNSTLSDTDKQAYLATYQEIETQLPDLTLPNDEILDLVSQWRGLSKQFYAQIGVSAALLDNWAQDQDGAMAELVAGLRRAMIEDAGDGVEQGEGVHEDANAAGVEGLDGAMLETLVEAERMSLVHDPDGTREFEEMTVGYDGPQGANRGGGGVEA